MHKVRLGTPEATADPAPAEIVARMTNARRSGNPDALWPDVSRARRVAAGRRVTHAVQHALADEPAALTADDTTALGVAAHISGVGPLLGFWIGEGRIVAPAPTHALFAQHLADNQARTARLRRETLRLVEGFRSIDVDPILLKGLHIGMVYPDPGTRPQSDIDFLVPGAHRAAIEHYLQEHGWRPERDIHQGRRVTWNPPGQPDGPRRLDRAGPDDPWTLDLHWTLDRAHRSGVFRVGDAASVTRATLRQDTVNFTVLGPRDFAYFIVLHASLSFDSLQFNRLVDLILLGRRRPTFWTDAWARADELGNPMSLYPAAALTERVRPGTIPSGMLGELEGHATRFMRAAVRSVDPGTILHGDTRTLRQGIMWARGPWQVFVTLAQLALTPGTAVWRRRLLLLTRRPWLDGRA